MNVAYLARAHALGDTTITTLSILHLSSMGQKCSNPSRNSLWYVIRTLHTLPDFQALYASGTIYLSSTHVSHKRTPYSKFNKHEVST
jgi:hypothetical protein